MIARTAVVTVLGLTLLVVFGCGDGGDDYFKGQKGQLAGGASLDIAGTYLVTPDTFGFNMMTISQSGNNLTATDNGGGSWSGRLSNVKMEEKTAPGGGTLFTWRGDISLTGRNGVGDELSLTGVIEIAPVSLGGVMAGIITAQFENRSIGMTGQLILTQVSTVPGGMTGGAGDTGGSGRENK